MHASTRRNRFAVTLGAIAAGVIVGILPLMHADAATVVSRISGADRYETAANISADAFSPGVGAVYLATGQNFPDALAAGAAAAKLGGPVLLTQTNTLPTVTKNELDRLDPAKIVVVGGTSAVSDTVKDSLQQYTAGTVTRVSGADRFVTAANVSAAVFPTNVSTVFVATGATFPDALAGGPAVANAPAGGGPLLLVQQNSIPTATKDELTRLHATKVVVLGGTSAVSEAVKDELDDYSVDPVGRRFGADRYLTSVDISANSFSSASKVYLATGGNYPDALAGGPAAALADGPVLLAQRSCITPEVNAEITRLNPDKLIVLGGDAALTDAVLSRAVCEPTTSTSSPVPTFTTTQDPCMYGSIPSFPGFPGCP